MVILSRYIQRNDFLYYLLSSIIFLVRNFVVSGNSGVIQSPNYPESYDINKSYYWKITTSRDQFIEISFDDFTIEDRKGACVTDFLQVYDGVDINERSLGKFCGDKKLDNIRSTGNSMLVHFNADNEVGSKGFRLNWRAVTKTTTTTTPTTTYVYPEGT